MAKVLSLGASGKIAQHVITKLADNPDADMTLYLRDSTKLGRRSPGNSRIVEGDVLDAAQLRLAMTGQDVVYANLAGAVDQQAVAALIVELLTSDGSLGRQNLGVSKPGTEGDKPAFA